MAVAVAVVLPPLVVPVEMYVKCQSYEATIICNVLMANFSPPNTRRLSTRSTKRKICLKRCDGRTRWKVFLSASTTKRCRYSSWSCLSHACLAFSIRAAWWSKSETTDNRLRFLHAVILILFY